MRYAISNILMKHTEAKIGRVFVLRLEDGDKIPDCIEDFCAEKKISHGQAVLVGGLRGGKIVVGPKDSDATAPEAVLLPVDEAHEVVAAGVIAPDEKGLPVLHIHGSLGRGESAKTGCLRPGIDTWLVGEAVIYELLDANATRRKDGESGFSLLDID